MTISEVSGATAPRGRSLQDLVDRERKRHRRKRLSWWMLAVLIPAIAAAVWVAFRPRPVPMADRFRTVQVTRGDIVREVLATGHLEAVTTVQVGSETSGRISTVEVDYNDAVKAGQVLARFDPAILAAQVAQARAGVVTAQLSVAQAKTELAKATRDERRATQLLGEHLVSQADHEAVKSAAALAALRLSAAKSGLAAQQAAYALAKTNRDHGVIRSPIDGIVITRNVDPGQTVASMFQTPTLFTVAADLKKMRVIAAVDEADIGEITVGQRASFTVSAYGGRAFAGEVIEVRSSPVVVQDVVTYGAVVSVVNPELLLKPGMTASVRIETASAKDTVRVPNAALRFTPPGREPTEAPGVWLLDGVELRRVAVEAGVDDEEHTELRSSAVAPGTQILAELTPQGRVAYGLSR